MNLKEVTDLSSIGTLFAFVLVNAGVIVMESHKSDYHTGFRVPYINGKWIVPVLLVIGVLATLLFRPTYFSSLLTEPEWWHNIPIYSFLIVCVFISFLAFRKNFSLIPVLGLLSNFYLMTELGLSNWIGFSIWLVIGLVIYLSYGIKNSLLNPSK